ncbi:MAG: hypothetical protein CMO60_10545 [Verrucomicrobiales bacterium]|nr:hypothetical protein [Verrucomicrobiales bacterium]
MRCDCRLQYLRASGEGAFRLITTFTVSGEVSFKRRIFLRNLLTAPADGSVGSTCRKCQKKYNNGL